MFLRDAINGVIAGISICMLLPALAGIAEPGTASSAERMATGKSGKPAIEQADRYLHDEFADTAIRIEPATHSNAAYVPPETQEAPLHGYGSFEGVVLVAPGRQGAGVVLVEPAAAAAPAAGAAPVAETAEEEEGDIPKDLSEEQEDPFESLNRFFFGFNELLDHMVLEPTARIYHGVVPPPVRQGISNAVRNLSSPVILANDILQGDRQRASDTIVRFMVNSTIGLGGLVDAAGYMGVQYHQEDFGQTLAVWGAGPGPYMVVPVLGPSNPRDLTGKVVDTAFNPLTWILLDAPIEERLAPSAVELVVGRESILDDYATLRKTSPDVYASVRDIYGQKRQTEISNGDITGEPIPDVTSLPPNVGVTTVTPF